VCTLHSVISVHVTTQPYIGTTGWHLVKTKSSNMLSRWSRTPGRWFSVILYLMFFYLLSTYMYVSCVWSNVTKDKIIDAEIIYFCLMYCNAAIANWPSDIHSCPYWCILFLIYIIITVLWQSVCAEAYVYHWLSDITNISSWHIESPEQWMCKIQVKIMFSILKYKFVCNFSLPMFSIPLQSDLCLCTVCFVI